MKTILVVDDDPNVVMFVRAALRDRPFGVQGVGSAEEALLRVRERAPDICLLDIRLPGLSGLDAFRALRHAGVSAPIVMITSHASMDVAVEAMKEGAYDFLTKPVKVDHLAELLERFERATTAEAHPIDSSATADEGPETRLVGKSPAMIEVYKTIGRVAQTDATVLITGESGSGKELVARIIHQHSMRHSDAFIAVNCAAIPEQLLENELFGHEKGAFTGATSRKIGTFERGNRGTLFLDEIGDMSLMLQAKILRALQEHEIERVGGNERIPIDVRVIAATNQVLEGAVAAGTFREELYYRLAVVRLALPPLRQRRDDIRRLADHFVSYFSRRLGRPVERVSAEVYDRLEKYEWPGNVRELRNVIARALVMSRGATLMAEDLPELAIGPLARNHEADPLCALTRERMSLAEVERRYIVSVLEELDWNYSRAVDVLAIHRNTLRRKLARYGIRRPRG